MLLVGEFRKLSMQGNKTKKQKPPKGQWGLGLEPTADGELRPPKPLFDDNEDAGARVGTWGRGQVVVGPRGGRAHRT